MSSTAVTGWTLRTLNFLLPRRPTMAQGNAQQLLYYCLVTRSETPRIAVLLSESALLSHSLFSLSPSQVDLLHLPLGYKDLFPQKGYEGILGTCVPILLVLCLTLDCSCLVLWVSRWSLSLSSSASLHVPGFLMIHLASGYTHTIFTTTTSISFHLQHFSERATTN